MTPHRFATLGTDMKGFAQIPARSRGQCTNTFDFTGVAGQSSYAISLAGPREGPFSLTADPDVVSWSPCGGTTSIMNMNTQCNISPTQQQALIAVSSYHDDGCWCCDGPGLTSIAGRQNQRQAHPQRLCRVAQVPQISNGTCFPTTLPLKDGWQGSFHGGSVPGEVALRAFSLDISCKLLSMMAVLASVSDRSEKVEHLGQEIGGLELRIQGQYIFEQCLPRLD